MLYRNIKYKQNIVGHELNDFIKVYFLHCFIQQHVSAIAMSHLQADYIFLVRQNIQLALLLLLLLLFTRFRMTYTYIYIYI